MGGLGVEAARRWRLDDEAAAHGGRSGTACPWRVELDIISPQYYELAKLSDWWRPRVLQVIGLLLQVMRMLRV